MRKCHGKLFLLWRDLGHAAEGLHQAEVGVTVSRSPYNFLLAQELVDLIIEGLVLENFSVGAIHPVHEIVESGAGRHLIIWGRGSFNLANLNIQPRGWFYEGQ